MFHHIVIWKFKDSANGKSKAENIEICRSSLQSLVAKIPQIKQLRIGVDQLQTKASYDMILLTEFNSLEDFYVYRDHPDHLEAAKYISSCVEDRACIDYEAGN